MYVARKEQKERFRKWLRHDHVHTPKTGGASICQSLSMYQSHDPLWWRLKTWPDYLGEVETVSLWVRDPWDRALSWWLYSGICDRQPSFERWVLDGMTSGWRVQNGTPRMLHQEDWLRGIEDARAMELGVFVGRFENMEQDFYRLCEWMGLKGAPELIHANHRAENADDYPQYAAYAEYRKDYRPLWTDEMRAAGETNFKVMIERYGYEFGGIYE